MSPTLLGPSRPAAPPVIDSETLTELEYGETVEKPEKGIRSNVLASEIYFIIRLFLSQHRLGQVFLEALLILDRASSLKRRLDVCFVTAQRWPLDKPLPAEGDWEVVPDLAIEVISPNDPFEKVHAKLGEYFAHGVREVWVIVPSQNQAHLYTSPTQPHILTSEASLKTELVPGLEIPLRDLFARIS